ncbi:hypothetical protein V8G54_005736, partial [Vigna mungo]
MVVDGVVPNVFTFNILIKVLMLEDMSNHGLRSDEKTFIRFMQGFIEESNVDGVLRIKELMLKFGYTLTTFFVVSSWIKKVACLHQLPDHQIAVTCATVLTYGSYGLGVHSSGSDIDALCVAPFFASIA